MISLVSLVSEILKKEKTVFGKGVEHDIFPSIHNPNIVYKVGKRKNVEFWVNIFKKNESFFPKIYKYGKIQKSNLDLYFVAIEKLNTDRVKEEWRTIEDALLILGHIDENNVDGLDQLFREIIFFDEVEYDSTVIFNSLKEYDEKVYKLFVKWVNFLHQVNSFVQPLKNRHFLDLHRGNFGYTKTGKLKCLDI